jgi:predicted  nucleic acid-binding Zn-ribbon protein
MDAPTGTALGAVGGAAIAGLFGWLRSRSTMDDAQASSMIKKLWSEVQRLQRRLDQCQEDHRQCEVRAGKLESEVASIREDLEELKRHLARSNPQ